MPETPDPSELKRWHQHFAIECNNRAWTLSVRQRTAAENVQMLNLAHAAAYHWDAVGSELNKMRATALLAEVHAAIGNGPVAMTLAQSMREFFLEQSDTPDWEVALTHTIVAHAAAAAGDKDAHRTAYDLATQTLAAIADDEDRAIVKETYDLVPDAL